MKKPTPEDQLTAALLQAGLYSTENKRQFWHSYVEQKHFLLEKSWDLFKSDNELSPSEAIEEAYNFLETFRREVIDVTRQDYFVKDKNK